jgi:hypothetical protein
MKYKITQYHLNEMLAIEKIKKFPKECEEIPFIDLNEEGSEVYIYVEAISKLNALYISMQIYKEISEEIAIEDFIEDNKFVDPIGRDNLMYDLHNLTKKEVKK